MCRRVSRRMLGRAVTDDQVLLVQNSFRLVVPIADTAAELFYARVFQLDPSLRALFPAAMADQRRKLMQMLSVVIGSLRYVDDLAPAIEALGRRHANYGVH